MPNNFLSSGQIQIGDSTYDNGGPNLNWIFTATGSGYEVAQSQTITSGSWQGLNFTASMKNGVYVAEIRNAGTGSVMIAGSSAGVGINPIIPPGGYNVYTFTGAGTIQALFAQATVAASSSIFHSSGIEK